MAEEQEAESLISPLGYEPGILVTPENFEEWRVRFHTAQDERRKREGKGIVKASQVTGKTLFLNDMVKVLEGEEAEPAKEGDEVFFYNKSLYGEEVSSGSRRANLHSCQTKRSTYLTSMRLDHHHRIFPT